MDKLGNLETVVKILKSKNKLKFFKGLQLRDCEEIAPSERDDFLDDYLVFNVSHTAYDKWVVEWCYQNNFPIVVSEDRSNYIEHLINGRVYRELHRPEDSAFADWVDETHPLIQKALAPFRKRKDYDNLTIHVDLEERLATIKKS